MINVKGLNLEFRNFKLQDINLDVASSEYFFLVGPTGAGKTVLLETIAGLHNPNSGKILIDGQDITLLESEKRNIGMVYQDSALFPHLTVAENIVFGLKVRRVPENIIKKTLDEISSAVSVQNLLDRKPKKLSGGEKQKVAIARALAVKPQLLLLDEPLSALDPETREGLQRELKRMQMELNLTVVHVTHDFDEAMLMGNHMAVISEGRIRQAGTTEEIFNKPNSEFVARFTMMRNIYAGAVSSNKTGQHVFRTGNWELVVHTVDTMGMHACIRPDDIVISPDITDDNGVNSFNGMVSRIEDRGMMFHVFVEAQADVCCLVTRRQFREMSLIAGQKVNITINPEAVHVF
jgi:ABC-type sugar transport system ATPase subunit